MKANIRIPAATAVIFLSLVPGLRAATINWTNAGTGNWAISNNWSSGTVPGAGDLARIVNGGTAQVTNAQSAHHFVVAEGGTSSGALQVLSGGSLSASSGVVGWDGGSGSLLIREGAMSLVSSGTSLSVGSLSGSQGTVTLSDGGTLTLGGSLTLGFDGGFGRLRIGEGGAAGASVSHPASYMVAVRQRERRLFSTTTRPTTFSGAWGWRNQCPHGDHDGPGRRRSPPALLLHRRHC